MSLKKVEQVKADKGFKIWDLIMYGAIAAIVVVLFITLFAVRDTSPLKGIRVVLGNEVVYEYDFENGKQISCNTQIVEITDDNAESVSLKVKSGEEDYNYILITKSGSAKMTDANCDKRDCVYAPEIKDNSGVIYCSPHRLKIIPYDFDMDNGNIIM